MKISCLVENTTSRQDLEPRHGLSVLVETRETCLLFDLGPDGTFEKNARAMGIDLSQIRLAVISHGHRDHGGGLDVFKKICPAGQIFMTRKATGRFFVHAPGQPPRDISPDKEQLADPQCRFIEEDTRISDTLSLFTGFEKTFFVPRGNNTLFREGKDGKLMPDDFDHELALLVHEDEKRVLFTGCSHSGISNMVSTVLHRTGLDHIDLVVGGCHLFNPTTGETEPCRHLDSLARELAALGSTRFYTGHCTGAKAFAYLKKSLGRRLIPLSTGTRIVI